jgi:hypothetical protein
MALESVTAAAAPAARGDAFVAERLATAQRRIRTLDLAAAGLGFLAGTCAYAAIMIGVDRLFAQAEIARQLLFFGYLVCAAFYIAFFVVRPLTRRINPYFAARQVERTLPGAKNSVVNWIDLHGQPLPPAIRNALGLRAAKDLARVDLDQAVSGRRTGIVGGVAAATMGLLLVMLIWLGGGPFADGLARAFAPFRFSGPSRTRTKLTLLIPESGSVTVSVGKGVAIRVELGGKVPDPKGPEAVCLLYRYGEDEPWLQRVMTDESGNEFSTSISATEVRSGFWYKVTGGDAETAEYRVSVCSTPQLTDFQATYHFPAYAAAPKQTRRERLLRSVRGTEVVLWALTNRTVRDAHVDFEGKVGGRITFPGQLVAGDAQAFQVRMPMKQTGLYRIGFTSIEGDTFTEQLHPVEVLADFAPEVELTKPGADVALPANGLLALEGRAADDFGVHDLTLRLKTGDRTLKPRPYRSAEALQLSGGGYPLAVAYKDALDLATIKADDIGPFHPQAGMEIEYWLEASDACDPKANVSASKHYRVKLTEPQKDEAKQKNDREQAKKEQQQHEAKQDEQLKQEAEARQEQARDADEQENKHGKGQDKDNNDRKSESSQGGDKNDAAPSEKNDQSQGKDDSSKGGTQAQQGGGDGGENKPQPSNSDAENRDNARKLKDVLSKSGRGGKESSDKKGNGGQDKRQPGDGADTNPESADQNQPGNRNESRPDQGNTGGDDKKSGTNSDSSSAAQGQKDSDKNNQKGAKPEGGDPDKAGASAGNENGSRTNDPAKDRDKPAGDRKKDESRSDKAAGQQDPATDPGKSDQSPASRQGDRNDPAKRDPADAHQQDKPAGDPKSERPSDTRSKGPDARPDQDRSSPPKPDSGKDQSPRANDGGKEGEKKENNGNLQPRKPAKSDRDKEQAPGTKDGNAAEDKKAANADGRARDASKAEGVKEQAPKSNDENRAGDKKETGAANQSREGSQADGGKESSSKPDAKGQGERKKEAPGDGPSSANQQDKTGKATPPPEKGAGADRAPGDKSAGRNDSPGKANKGDNTSESSGNRDSTKDGANAKDKPRDAASNAAAERKPAEKNSSPGAKDSTPEDARKAADESQSKDADKRADAAKKLDQMAKQATDPRTREQAQKALERMDAGSERQDETKNGDDKARREEKERSPKANGSSASDLKKAREKADASSKQQQERSGQGDPAKDKVAPKKDGETDKPSGEGLEGKGPKENGSKDGKNDEKESDAKPASKPANKPNGQPGPGSDDTPQNGNDRGKDSGKKPDPSARSAKDGPGGKWDPNAARQKNMTRDPADTPGDGDPDNRPVDAKTDDASPPNAAKTNRKDRAANRSTELQLEDLKKVTKQDLEAAKLTEKDLAALRQWLEAQRNRDAKGTDPKDAAVAPQQGGPGGSFSSGPVQTPTTGKAGNLSRRTRALPPPGYIEANEALKRLLNKPDPDSP